VIFALGIRHVGEGLARTLAKRFRTMDALAAAPAETLTAVEDVGPKVAESVLFFFAQPENRDLVRDLAAAGVAMTCARPPLSAAGRSPAGVHRHGRAGRRRAASGRQLRGLRQDRSSITRDDRRRRRNPVSWTGPRRSGEDDQRGRILKLVAGRGWARISDSVPAAADSLLVLLSLKKSREKEVFNLLLPPSPAP
jgi:NAD-dependent DNA ligase